MNTAKQNIKQTTYHKKYKSFKVRLKNLKNLARSGRGTGKVAIAELEARKIIAGNKRPHDKIVGKFLHTRFFGMTAFFERIQLLIKPLS